MENAAVPLLVCRTCQLNSKTGLQAVQSKDGGTVCKQCTSSIDPSVQRTLVLHKFFEVNLSLDVNLTIHLPFNTSSEQGREESSRSGDVEVDGELKELFDCPICRDLLFDPVTSACGHSFCRQCLSRAIDHNPACPFCRAPLPQYSVHASRPRDLLVEHLIKVLFTASFAERAAREKQNSSELENNLPVFVCSWAYPKLPCDLHVFEPRYRLMMRRAMEGQRLFGMIAHTSRGPCQYGTVLRIEELEMLPDGRSLVATVGVRKFKILERGNCDGYMTAKVEYIDDEEDTSDTSRGKSLEEEHNNTKALLYTFLQRLPYQLSHRLMEPVGPIPDDPKILPYWIVSFMQPFGISEQSLTLIYTLTRPIERMRLARSLLFSLMVR
eukprot:TRINITY_DN518_c0_g1_i11.p1 TRINITY_DN518_c0_g1~~TRINITY_DN518_c0_g1_i11.p1  ORF type:complete len:382 (-),score=52.30 TRINITY_DN518_c0_g1_i11:233-1378(-)